MTNDVAHPRSAKIQLEAVSRLRVHLRMIKASLTELALDSTPVDRLLSETHVIEQKLEHLAQGRIEPRKRYKPIIRPEGANIPEYYLFLDECGSHVAGQIDERFPVFCLSGVVISKDD